MNDEAFGFSEADARGLLDLLNPADIGAAAPQPVQQLISVLVKITAAVSASSGATPGSGTGVMVRLQEAPGPVFTVVPITPTMPVPIKSFRTVAVAVDSLVLVVRDQLQNEWWIA